MEVVGTALNAEAAIEEVRRLRPGSIEDPSQEDAIFAYANHRRTSPAFESPQEEAEQED